MRDFDLWRKKDPWGALEMKWHGLGNQNKENKQPNWKLPMRFRLLLVPGDVWTRHVKWMAASVCFGIYVTPLFTYEIWTDCIARVIQNWKEKRILRIKLWPLNHKRDIPYSSAILISGPVGATCFCIQSMSVLRHLCCLLTHQRGFWLCKTCFLSLQNPLWETCPACQTCTCSYWKAPWDSSLQVSSPRTPACPTRHLAVGLVLPAIMHSQQHVLANSFTVSYKQHVHQKVGRCHATLPAPNNCHTLPLMTCLQKAPSHPLLKHMH